MKVLVVNNAVPFIWGGAEELAANLERQLNKLPGVEAEVLRIPFQWEPKERLAAEILLNQSFSAETADRVIALKFPAYLLQHRNKTIWLLHQFRQAYDLLSAGQSYLSRDKDGDLIEAIKRSDEECFDGARKMFANSPVTRDRLNWYNDRSCEVLYPPLNDAELFVPRPHGDYIFAGGRVGEGKRQHLLLEAARLAGEKCRLVIAGPPESQAYADRLRAYVEKHDLGHRVTLNLHMHTRAEIAYLVTNARACAYIPFDEDSLGYVTMEAFASGRAVVTTFDSGGLLEIVKQETTGLVCSPEAESLAEALAKLSENNSLAQNLGNTASGVWAGKNITWPNTLERLLS